MLRICAFPISRGSRNIHYSQHSAYLLVHCRRYNKETENADHWKEIFLDKNKEIMDKWQVLSTKASAPLKSTIEKGAMKDSNPPPSSPPISGDGQGPRKGKSSMKGDEKETDPDKSWNMSAEDRQKYELKQEDVLDNLRSYFTKQVGDINIRNIKSPHHAEPPVIDTSIPEEVDMAEIREEADREMREWKNKDARGKERKDTPQGEDEDEDILERDLPDGPTRPIPYVRGLYEKARERAFPGWEWKFWAPNPKWFFFVPKLHDKEDIDEYDVSGLSMKQKRNWKAYDVPLKRKQKWRTIVKKWFGARYRQFLELDRMKVEGKDYTPRLVSDALGLRLGTKALIPQNARGQAAMGLLDNLAGNQKWKEEKQNEEMDKDMPLDVDFFLKRTELFKNYKDALPERFRDTPLPWAPEEKKDKAKTNEKEDKEKENENEKKEDQETEKKEDKETEKKEDSKDMKNESHTTQETEEPLELQEKEPEEPDVVKLTEDHLREALDRIDEYLEEHEKEKFPPDPIPDIEFLETMRKMSPEEREQLYRDQLRIHMEHLPKMLEKIKNLDWQKHNDPVIMEAYQKDVEAGVVRLVDIKHKERNLKLWYMRTIWRPWRKWVLSFVEKERLVTIPRAMEKREEYLKQSNASPKEFEIHEKVKVALEKDAEKFKKDLAWEREITEYIIQMEEFEHELKKEKMNVALARLNGLVYKTYFYFNNVNKYAMRATRSRANERIFTYDAATRPQTVGLEVIQPRHAVTIKPKPKYWIPDVVAANFAKQDAKIMEDWKNSPYFHMGPSDGPRHIKTELPEEYDALWEEHRYRTHSNIIHYYYQNKEFYEALEEMDWNPFDENFEALLKKKEEERFAKWKELENEHDIATEEIEKEKKEAYEKLKADYIKMLDKKNLSLLDPKEVRDMEELIENEIRVDREQKEREKQKRLEQKKLKKEEREKVYRYLSYAHYNKYKKKGMLAYQLRRAKQKSKGKSMGDLYFERSAVALRDEKPPESGALSVFTSAMSDLSSSLSTTVFGKILPTIGLTPILKAFGERIPNFDLVHFQKKPQAYLPCFSYSTHGGRYKKISVLPSNLSRCHQSAN
eukprot:TRINITY_DN3687_c0_g1_i3.p1 TRINITY_DN3687_c0_g1~~TRINITY_DN3687_c0_g1_i3.p1  ORF type:complete len:1085 (-),score=327.46 TRINITY_DN3687_c0_g1_i3:453-3707(-)